MSPEEIEAFDAAKNYLANYTALAFPVLDPTISLVSDTNDDAAETVLQQELDGSIEPFGFFSRVFSRTERKYFAFDRKSTAIIMTFKPFRYFLESRNFTIYTDQKAIKAAIHSIRS